MMVPDTETPRTQASALAATERQWTNHLRKGGIPMSFAVSTPESVGMCSERLNRIRPGIQRWVDRGIISGASMRVARRNQIVYSEQVGMLDRESGEAMPDDAIFRVYSMTKPVICTALMTLYEEGRFQLFSPVAEFIPALGQVKVLEVDASGAERLVDPVRPITVGDLMAHTAGFTYDFLDESPVCGMYGEAQMLADADRSLQQFVQDLAEIPLAYHPGSCWNYSVSIDVAAHLIEVLADQPLRDFLRERMFGPLGMADTDFGVPEDKLPRLAAMYGAADLCEVDMTLTKHFLMGSEGRVQPLDVTRSYPVDRAELFARGGLGLFSTADDYLSFARMLFNNGKVDETQILGRKTVELMHANRIPAALLPLQIGPKQLVGYGFGLGSRVLLDVGAAGSPGTVDEFGWSGAASTYYWIDPAEELVGVFMTQYQGMEAPDADFRVLVYQAIVD
jgi:CubicO group peptidase (beta-lactamase class C family)